MSKHSLMRLASKIYNTPHLITPDAFGVIVNYIEARNSGIRMMIPQDTLDGPAQDLDNPDDSDNNNDIYVLDIDGSLTYKPVNTECGEVGTSYQQLEDNVDNAISLGVKIIVMNITSGGGEASHVFETASNIRSMCDAADVKLIAYADTNMCSAAYALGVIADKIVANPSASVGSIGCVVCLMDDSEAMKQEGLKRIFITSGTNKVPYNADGAFKQEFLDEIQADVDDLNTQFATFVEQYTGIDSKIIRGFEAAVFNADKALENGLVNDVMTNREFAAYVASVYTNGTY